MEEIYIRPAGNLNKLVLVIDDNHFMQVYMTSLLRQVGLEVIYAPDGPAGIKLFEQQQPAIVLVDANMPLMDGITVCSLIRQTEAGKYALIYMMTSRPDLEHVERAYAVGVDEYFTKPILEPVFLARIKKSIKEKHHMSENKILRNDLNKAQTVQAAMLPAVLHTDWVSVEFVYRPCGLVSGDCIDFWLSEDEQTVYGYVFDVAGHGFSSAMQVFAIRMLFCQARQKKAGDICAMLEYVNAEMFRNNRPAMVAAIVFAVHRRQRLLEYVSAAISPFYVRRGADLSAVSVAGFPLGYKRDAPYVKKSLPLKGVDELVFGSDGFSEIVDCETKDICNDDDISAIMLKLIEKQEEPS